MNRREIQEEARRRKEKVADEARKKKMRDTNKRARDEARGGPPRKKRPNGTITEAERKAERNKKVAIHRARNAGKTEDEAQAAGRAAYLRAIAKHAPDDDRDRLLREAGEIKDGLGKNFTKKPKYEEDDKPLCGARRTNNGEPIIDEETGERVTCQQLAGWGTDHVGFGRCKFHGGAAPNGIKAAEVEKVMTEMIESEIRFYGEARDIDPIQALADEVRRTAGHVAWLAEQVRQETQLTETTSQGRQANMIIQMYQNERDRLVKVSQVAIAAGIAERQVQLAEQQGQILASVIRDILWDKELSLTPEQRHKSSEIVRRHLMAIDTTATELPALTESG